MSSCCLLEHYQGLDLLTNSSHYWMLIKDLTKFYYWTGLQLLMRAVFFGISSLDRNINIVISILLLSVIIGLHGMMRPLKVKHKNYQEMLLFFNLH